MLCCCMVFIYHYFIRPGDFMEAIEGDARVLSSEEQDSTMTDVGEKSRPLGDPPEVQGSWASKVKGKCGGGMPIPEEVIDETFVSERVCLEFPDGEDGEPVITIAREVLDDMNGLWKNCMIVKVLRRNISLLALNRRLNEMWKPNGAMHVMDLPRQFFMIRFDVKEEYMAALTGGPWRVFGSYLLVQAWSPGFDPLRDDIVTTPVWIRLSNLPVIFYHKSILMGIARGLGTPVKVDSATLNIERARFARVCVEVNLKKPLKGTVMINGARYFVAYEGLPNIFSNCGLYGHLVHIFPSLVQERNVVQPTQSVVALTNATYTDQADDGFTLVRRSSRKQSTPMNGTTSGSLGSENIVMSNRFENLDKETVSPGIREVAVSIGDNKENETPKDQRRKGKSAVQGQTVAFKASSELGKIGPREGHKERRMGGQRNMDINGPKAQSFQNHSAHKRFNFWANRRGSNALDKWKTTAS